MWITFIGFSEGLLRILRFAILTFLLQAASPVLGPKLNSRVLRTSSLSSPTAACFGRPNWVNWGDLNKRACLGTVQASARICSDGQLCSGPHDPRRYCEGWCVPRQVSHQFPDDADPSVDVSLLRSPPICSAHSLAYRVTFALFVL